MQALIHSLVLIFFGSLNMLPCFTITIQQIRKSNQKDHKMERIKQKSKKVASGKYSTPSTSWIQSKWHNYQNLLTDSSDMLSTTDPCHIFHQCSQNVYATFHDSFLKFSVFISGIHSTRHIWTSLSCLNYFPLCNNFAVYQPSSKWRSNALLSTKRVFCACLPLVYNCKCESYLANDIINIKPEIYVSIPPNTKASTIKQCKIVYYKNNLFVKVHITVQYTPHSWAVSYLTVHLSGLVMFSLWRSVPKSALFPIYFVQMSVGHSVLLCANNLRAIAFLGSTQTPISFYYYSWIAFHV
jgi:hypothetical protein